MKMCTATAASFVGWPMMMTRLSLQVYHGQCPYTKRRQREGNREYMYVCTLVYVGVFQGVLGLWFLVRGHDEMMTHHGRCVCR